MKKELLDKLEKLSEDLPPNTLDELIDELGGPENVAEVSPGRFPACRRSGSLCAPFGNYSCTFFSLPFPL